MWGTTTGVNGQKIVLKTEHSRFSFSITKAYIEWGTKEISARIFIWNMHNRSG